MDCFPNLSSNFHNFHTSKSLEGGGNSHALMGCFPNLSSNLQNFHTSKSIEGGFEHFICTSGISVYFWGVRFFCCASGSAPCRGCASGGFPLHRFFKIRGNKGSMAPRKAPRWPLRAPLTTQHAPLRASRVPSTTPGTHSSALGTREVGVVIFFYVPPKAH